MLQPTQFTVTANTHEYVTLSVEIRYERSTDFTMILWEKQSDSSTGFEFEIGRGKEFHIRSVTTEDAGVYAAYWSGLRDSLLGSLLRLIVRGKAIGDVCIWYSHF